MGQVSAMLYLLLMNLSKVLSTYSLQIQNSWQLSLLELPPPAASLFATLSLSPRTTPTCIPPLYNLTPFMLMLHSRLTLVFKPLTPFYPFVPSSALSSLPLLAVFLRLPLPLLPDSLRLLQWNAEGLRARNIKLLHFLSSHPVDLICIQESNLNLSSSLPIPGFYAIRSDRTHSRSGILSPDATHASGGVIIFVGQGLSFSELSTSSLSSLDPYSDYVGINISLNNSSSLSFLNLYAFPIRSSPTDSRINFFSSSILPPPEISSF